MIIKFLDSSLFTGLCTICQGIPSFKISYDVGQGNKLIEYYCEKDLPNRSELDNRLQNINCA
jgi:hypothetical protein